MSKVKVYKDGKEFVCVRSQAERLVADQGYTWEPTKKTSAKASKPKAKVKADADVIPIDSTFNDGEPINIDLGDINTEE